MTLLSPIETGSAHQSGARLSRRALGFALALLLALSVLAPARALADVRGNRRPYASVEARGVAGGCLPECHGEFALVMDDEGTVYFSRGARSSGHPDRLHHQDRDGHRRVGLRRAPDSTVTVSQEGPPRWGRVVGEPVGGRHDYLEVALTGLMIPSGNDAAVAIAETLGG